jgi:hypothetical protein
VPLNYAVFTFKVPAGADRLNASIAWHGSVVDLILIDPQGRFAADSFDTDRHSPLIDVWLLFFMPRETSRTRPSNTIFCCPGSAEERQS